MKSAIRIAIAVLMVVGACKPAPPPTTTPTTSTPEPRVVTEEAPKRLLFFIGDGMGVGQLTAATYAKGAPLEMFSMPHVSWVTTHEYEFLTTESASAATALSTGRKTHYEAVSVVPGTTEANEEDPATHMQTLHELASDLGLGTGLVATSRITHATPAAFVAHRYHRHQYDGLARDYANSEVDLLLGSGWGELETKEGTDYWALMKERGWYLAKTPEELAKRPLEATRVAGLFHKKDMPFLTSGQKRVMPLDELTAMGIEILDATHPQGWVLMVEGSFVDWCAHSLDMLCATAETLDLDGAVKVGLAYARNREDTLVVVTADHETGGLSVLDPEHAGKYAEILGGEEAATKLAALPVIDGKPRDAAPPFQHIDVGAWDMQELADKRATLVVGHFSMASRPLWNSSDRFFGAHTPTMVALFAEGPGARTVAAARDNADVGAAIRDLVSRGAKKETINYPAPIEARPKNVVLFVGDGMGIPAVTGAYYHQGGLEMVELPYHGIATTHAVDGLVNDSPAAATALATGHRTRRAAIGMVVENGTLTPAETVLERAESRGLSTGIVTTTSITHATPAAFYAHQKDREQLEGIVSDLLALPQRVEGSDGVDVLIGGGLEDFDERARGELATRGYHVTTTWPPAGAGKLAALLADGGLGPAAFRHNDDDPKTPTLAEMTAEALKRLSADEDGFLLVVEGGQIDWRMHDVRRDASVLEEVEDFDEAVATATEFANDRADTLVLVTSDHDHTMTLLDNHYAFESGRCGVATACGGPFDMLAIPVKAEGIRNGEGLSNAKLQGEYAPPRLHLQYPWPIQEAALRVDVGASHSANLVPIFAVGPWAARFSGYLDQPAIGRILLDWIE